MNATTISFMWQLGKSIFRVDRAVASSFQVAVRDLCDDALHTGSNGFCTSRFDSHRSVHSIDRWFDLELGCFLALKEMDAPG